MKEKMQEMMGGMMGAHTMGAHEKAASQPSSTPPSMLTAMGEEMDPVVSLELGANDDLAKPCSARKLLARIRAMLRRGSSTIPRVCASCSPGPSLS
jgi:DNA-binding response OmpR family regulator